MIIISGVKKKKKKKVQWPGCKNVRTLIIFGIMFRIGCIKVISGIQLRSVNDHLTPDKEQLF